jgi:hypothetical protein
VKLTVRVLVLCGLLAATQASATEIFEKVGTVGGQFLKIGIGARASGMGDAFTSIADDASAAFWNPAGLARLKGNTIAVHHAAWPAQLDLNAASYAFGLGFMPGMFAVNLRALSMSPELRTDTTHPDGDGRFFDAGDVLIGMSYARSLTDKFSAGINVNFIQETLADYKASSVSFDLGVLYDTGYRSLRLGMAIANIGSEMQFIESTGESVKLPIVFRLGSSINFLQTGAHTVLGAVEFSHPPDNAERGNVGVEYGFRNFFFLRGGHKFNYDTEGLTAGAGVEFPASESAAARIDYAYNDFKTLGTVHRFSVELQF